ncbi:protein-glutamine glutaminase family protein [Bacteriovorax sp. Seq25_V]|uniref:protein-glutamine glutaminase family protein n=1 Tax=Bacteriovorax sp. Seq25_V TaxID=1201288 RepID=UPI00038A54C9|nr:protein-glutamine glutaminase family protein [Bacteriovorax sp. Seq25_V]EQC45377.1 hypothetical protein M900_2183 [Bacteriovorax sp. Seq25_V]
MKKIFVMAMLSTYVCAAQVVLTDGRSLKNCTVGKEQKDLVCVEGEKTFYISSSLGYEEPKSFEINEKDSNSRMILNYIDHIIDDDGTFLYAQNGMDLYDNSDHGVKGKIADVRYNQQVAGFYFPEESKDFPVILDKIKKITKRNIERVKKQINEEGLFVNLNGKKQSCNRLNGPNCNIAKCGESLMIFGPYTGNDGFINLPLKNGKIDFSQPEISEVFFESGELAIGVYPDTRIDAIRNTVPSKYAGHAQFAENIRSGGGQFIEREVGFCDGLSAKPFKNLKEKIDEDYKNSQMIELVDFIDGSVDSILVNELALPDIVCTHNGAYYNPDAFKQIASKQSQQLSVVTLEKAKELFKKARQRDDIAWGYTEDGCYARAHLMTEMFKDAGVKADKVWARGRLTIPNGYGATWSYHVAPILHVLQDDGSVKKMVIDPSISNEPTSVDEWLKTMKVSNKDVAINDYPSPMNAKSFGKVSVSFSNDEPYWPMFNDYDKQTKDDMAEATMSEYLMYQ